MIINRLTNKVGCIRNHIRTRSGAARTAVRTPSPATAEGGIEDHRVLVEIVFNVARRRTPKACWLSPVCRCRRFIVDIRRNVCTCKVPHRYASRRVPQKRIDTSPSIVEAITERSRITVTDATPSIGSRCAVAIRAERMTGERSLVGRVDRAGIRCPAVESHLIVRLIVDAFHNINLSALRPRRPIGLQSTAI